MLWLVLAFGSALFESLKDLFSKKGLQQIDPYIVAWAMPLYALPFLMATLFFIDIPALEPRFWPALVGSGLLNVGAAVLFMKAIQRSDLSVTVPLVTFTPIFLLLTSPILVGEFPRPLGLAGVVFIVLGSYALHLREWRNGILAPFRALLSERGPQLMLVASVLWSVTANLDKIAIQASSPRFYPVAVIAFVATALAPLAIWRSQGQARVIATRWRNLLPVGFFVALTLSVQMTALSLALVAYVIAIKRLSTVLSVLWGHLVFGEHGLAERALGAGVMVVGVFLIAVS
ncbi:MAG: EamA family transporter [Candidatus Bipolaricaulia bacterium]